MKDKIIWTRATGGVSTMEIVLLLLSTLVARLVNIVFPIDGAFNLKVSVATVDMGR